MDLWTIIFILLVLFEAFVLMKNLSSKSEMKRIEQEGVVVAHHEKRKWVRNGRIACAVFAGIVVIFCVVKLISGDQFFLIENLFTLIAVVISLMYFTIAPYDMEEWLILDRGVYIYNAGALIPWTQVITTGQIEKKNTHTVVIQIKKEAGELFKAQYQLIHADSKEEAEQIGQLIRQFVHAMDRKKMFKRNMEEKKIDIRKRKWY